VFGFDMRQPRNPALLVRQKEETERSGS